ncbi:MAG TPA: protease modulator HflK [Novosphingobium sp.]|nr:protease modulator HflK [Novosphingobium sp.]
MSEPEGPKRRRKTKADSEATPAEATPPEAAAESPAPAPEPVPEQSGPPRNPWLPPAADEPAQRRSASIDDILRQRRLPGGGMPRPGSPGLAVWGVVGIVSAWLLVTSVHVLAEGERGIVSTFGRYSSTIGPGLNLTLPWPIQQVTRRAVGAEVDTLLPDKESETLMLTRDGELIDVRVQVRWRVNDLRLFSTALPDGEAAVRRLTDSITRAAVAEMSFDELRGGTRQAELQQRIKTRLQRVLTAWKSGVTVVTVAVTDTKPPARLAETFKTLAKENEAARKNHEEAEVYAQQVRVTANDEAAAFDRAYELYRVAPDAVREQMYYETVEKVLRNNPVSFGESGTKPAAAPAANAKAEGGR